MEITSRPTVVTTAPLFSHLVEYSRRRPVQFHIPAHKRGRGMDPDFRDFVGANALAIDLINIDPLDDLHRPHDAILRAEELAAEAFGADHTFFSVQGTSTAVMAMIMAVCRPGDKILVPRNAHRSVTAGLILSGASPVYLAPEVDRARGIAHTIDPDTVETALQVHSDARAVLLVNPTYYGACADLRRIVQLAHDRDIPVLVDEAHGAHFYFNNLLPESAMAAGADLSATSMHKTAGSLTQSSVLNVQGTRVDPHALRAMLSLLTTTSTSYILLSSLDAARRHMVVNGGDLLDRAITLSIAARHRINGIAGLSCFGDEIQDSHTSVDRTDPTKLCVSVKGLGMTGLDVERILRKEFNIEVEMSDLFNVLCLITIADEEAETTRLTDALEQLADRIDGSDAQVAYAPVMPGATLELTPREAFYAPKAKVPLAKAVNCIAGEWVSLYPPGIPSILPGEVITEDHVRSIQIHLDRGYPIQGPLDSTCEYLQVIRT